MPKVDMDMASGKIMSWHIAEGDAVVKGDPLFDIETDKAAMEVEAPADGILHYTAPEGMRIPIGTPCAWLYSEDEDVGEQPKPFAGMEDGSEASAEDTNMPEPAEDVGDAKVEIEERSEEAPELPAAESGKVRSTPRARSLASKDQLDLAEVVGSGPRGRIQAKDVLEAIKLRAEAPAPTSGPATFRPETGELAVSRSRGGTGIPIVMIHGFASDATSWAPIENHLNGNPIFRIDLPGHGKSPKLGIDSFADLVKSVRRAFDGLGLEKAHLLGHSLGGAVSLALADTRAKSVSSLTLIAPAGLGPEINGEALSGICNANRTESLGPWLRTLVANEDLITDSYIRLVMNGRADPNLRAAQTALSDAIFPDGVQAFDLRAALGRIEKPARIIWGKRDGIIPWKHALRAPGTIGLHLFEGVGHMPQIECAEAVGEIIRDCV
jgi:pyruvate dehydrogenase E2 component (dihydrolipoamide acetyltransferase)